MSKIRASKLRRGFGSRDGGAFYNKCQRRFDPNRKGVTAKSLDLGISFGGSEVLAGLEKKNKLKNRSKRREGNRHAQFLLPTMRCAQSQKSPQKPSFLEAMKKNGQGNNSSTTRA